MNVRRRGFTLIEILVVIGIILVLVGIVTVGIGYVTKAGKNNSVKVSLNNLRGMITELETSAGLASRQPTDWAWGGTGTKQVIPNPPAGQSVNVWKDADPSTPAVNDALFVPKGLVITAQSENDGPRYGKDADAIVNTQLIMQLLLGTPKNRTMLNQLPQGSLMEKLPPGVTAPKLIISTPDRTPTPGIPLDPWGNPMIFVPGAGLCGRDTTTAADDAMWLGGTDPNAADVKFVCPATAAPDPKKVAPISSPDGRPFWASAGPDGDFRTGDDNVYSFEN